MNDIPKKRSAPWWLRLLLVIAGLGLWFGSQHLIGLREASETRIGDTLLEVTAPAHQYLLEHPAAADVLLVVSSAIIDALGIFLLAWSIFGPSLRPFIGLLILFGLRQACQALMSLPTPPGMIWRQPELGGVEIPTLLVTYEVANDFFFSGHTALAVYGAVEIARLGRRRWLALGVAIAIFQATVVLLLRAHWTMDVFAGAVTALYVATLASWIAPPIDRALARLRRV